MFENANEKFKKADMVNCFALIRTKDKAVLFITKLYASAHSGWLIFYEKEMDGS